MSLKSEKEALKKALDEVEDLQLIQKLKSILDHAQKQDDIVGYTANGEPLTSNQFKQDIDEARRAYKEGNYLTNDAVKKQSKDW